MLKLIKNRYLRTLILMLAFYSVRSQVSADSVIHFAKRLQGIRYKYGGISPKTGFDCSGFVYYVFRHFNIDVPRASMDYENKGWVISADSAQKGDIIVFTGTNANIRKPGHVGIITEKKGNDLYFIHSSSGKLSNGIIITNYSKSANYIRRYIRLVRLNNVKQ